MLKRYKNALLQAIQASGLRVSDFHGHDDPDDPSWFVIDYRPADVSFSLAASPDDPHFFEYSYLPFTGTEAQWQGPFPENEYDAFDSVSLLPGGLRITFELQLMSCYCRTCGKMRTLRLRPQLQPTLMLMTFFPKSSRN